MNRQSIKTSEEVLGFGGFSSAADLKGRDYQKSSSCSSRSTAAEQYDHRQLLKPPLHLNHEEGHAATDRARRASCSSSHLYPDASEMTELFSLEDDKATVDDIFDSRKPPPKDKKSRRRRVPQQEETCTVMEKRNYKQEDSFEKFRSSKQNGVLKNEKMPSKNLYHDYHRSRSEREASKCDAASSSSSSYYDRNPAEEERVEVSAPEKSATHRNTGPYRNDVRIEVEPGVFVPLRGAEETKQALRDFQIGSTRCFCCETEVFCILTADFVICPVCRVVGPAMFEGEIFLNDDLTGGVGLGMTIETMEAELARLYPEPPL